MDPEENVDISIRNEQLALHRAMLAAAAARQRLMPCLMAFPWQTGLLGDQRVPELIGFLRATLDSTGSFPRWSAFLRSLGDDVDAWRAAVDGEGRSCWALLAELAPPGRTVLRDLAGLARTVPPSQETCIALLQRCLGPASGDPVSLAALVAVANAAGLQPGGDVLSAVLAHLEDAQRQQVAQRLPAMTGSEAGEAWVRLLEQELDPPASVELKETPKQDLRALLVDAPPAFCCQLDGRLLVDPVRTPYGHVCERSTLARRLVEGQCPFTGHPLTLSECMRDPELRKELRAWLRESSERRKKEERDTARWLLVKTARDQRVLFMSGRERTALQKYVIVLVFVALGLALRVPFEGSGGDAAETRRRRGGAWFCEEAFMSLIRSANGVIQDGETPL
ncbi:U-box domain-containing protein [Durusdinium trenchii]|uniref:U-box domain-containing protein n=1 Tax=Durusdinium trenchii TaxID=1381693 RepID=A0ABP0LJB9_9DINO